MRLGIDLGGTKIEVIALRGNGHEIYRKRVDTPQGDYQKTLQAIVDLVTHSKQQLLKQRQINASELKHCTLGIGIPGAISAKTGRIKNANSVCLIGQPLQQDLQNRLQQQVRISNDANCLAVSEATDGAAAGLSTVFGVIIGTGTGGGIVIGQQPVIGSNAIAGEWGHNPMPWLSSGEAQINACYCGRENCIETFLSGPGMLTRFRQLGGSAHSPQDIVRQAQQEEVMARDFMALYESWLARSLASVINILDPDAIVLGGGLSNIDSLYQNIPILWQEYVFSDQVSTALLKAKYGDSSGVRGAAWLWPI